MDDVYEVYALRYATLRERKASENFLGADPHEAGAPLDFYVWLVRNDKRSFLVDTGFNEAVGKRRERHFLRSPVEALRQMGVSATDVGEVIITHLHYDHSGNVDQFPNARIHLQDREMIYATGRHMCHPVFSRAYEPDEVTSLVRQVFKGRVAFHDGDAQLAPGVSVHLIGGHTMGIQSVRVRTEVGWIVLASDASHYYANMETERPFPIVYNVGDMVQGWQRLRELAERPEFVIPGHDPRVMERYPSAGAGLEGVGVRLDVAPKA